MTPAPQLVVRRPPYLVSASRRTDIPRFYAEWLHARRAAGFCEATSAFGSRERISLAEADVLGWLFWTRDPRPLLPQVEQLIARGTPVAFQMTITGYGADLEPHRVPLAEQLAAFAEVARRLPGPECLELRYDPLLVGGPYTQAWHVATLSHIAAAVSGHTRVVNTSLCEPYLRTVRRVGTALAYRAADPDRHRAMLRRHGPVAVIEPALLEELARVTARHGLELRTCANPETNAGPYPLPPSRCAAPELFTPYGAAAVERIAASPRAPSRAGCRCLRVADIGTADTCVAGCRYCYVVQHAASAERHHAAHDPGGVALR